MVDERVGALAAQLTGYRGHMSRVTEQPPTYLSRNMSSSKGVYIQSYHE